MVAREVADVHGWLQRVQKSGANRVALIFETSLRCRLVREWASLATPDFERLPAEMYDLASCIEAIQNAPEDRALLLAARDTELLPLVGSLTVQRHVAPMENAGVVSLQRPTCATCRQWEEQCRGALELLEDQLLASERHEQRLRDRIKMHEELLGLRPTRSEPN